MSTVTKENVGLLHEKINLTLSKEDYLPAFEKSLKEYSKRANIPGFRRGMVPSSLIRKMYGSSLFTDEVLRSIDRELVKYLETEKVEIFAQPLPDEVNLRQLDMNTPTDYHFSFEIGLKPDFTLADLGKAETTRYKVQITDDMINSEIARLQNRYGNMKDEETVTNEENVLNVTFTEVDENGNPEDVTLSFNLSGIRMNEAAFRKLQQEISLEPLKVKLPPSFASSDKGEYRLYSATVPVDRDIFRKIVVRESRIPRIDSVDFSVKGWTERLYYEICTDPAIYAAFEKRKGAIR